MQIIYIIKYLVKHSSKKFKQNKKVENTIKKRVLAPNKIDLLIYFLCVSMSFKINTDPNEIPIEIIELLIFKNSRTLITSS